MRHRESRRMMRTAPQLRFHKREHFPTVKSAQRVEPTVRRVRYRGLRIRRDAACKELRQRTRDKRHIAGAEKCKLRRALPQAGDHRPERAAVRTLVLDDGEREVAFVCGNIHVWRECGCDATPKGKSVIEQLCLVLPHAAAFAAHEEEARKLCCHRESRMISSVSSRIWLGGASGFAIFSMSSSPATKPSW